MSSVSDRDLRILAVLENDGETRQKALGQKFDLQAPAITKILEKLEESGIFVRKTVEVDYDQAGYNFVCLMRFRLKERTSGSSDETVKFLSRINNVIEINKILHEDIDFFVKIMSRNTKEYQSIVEQINEFEHIDPHTSSTYTISERVKDRPGVSLDFIADHWPVKHELESAKERKSRKQKGPLSGAVQDKPIS